MVGTDARSLHEDAVRVLTGWRAPDEQQERLRTSYVEHLRRHRDGISRSCVPAHLTASAVVLDATGEHVLLALHRKGGFWAQVGGHVEPGDRTLSAAALREATEESGIEGLRLLGSAPVDLDAHQLSGAFGSCGEHLDVRFVVVAPAGAEPVASEESDDVRWFGWDALPRDAVVDLTRLVSAARALFALVGQPGPSTSGAMSSPTAAATPSR